MKKIDVEKLFTDLLPIVEQVVGSSKGSITVDDVKIMLEAANKSTGFDIDFKDKKWTDIESLFSKVITEVIYPSEVSKDNRTIVDDIWDTLNIMGREIKNNKFNKPNKLMKLVIPMPNII